MSPAHATHRKSSIAFFMTGKRSRGVWREMEHLDYVFSILSGKELRPWYVNRRYVPRGYYSFVLREVSNAKTTKEESASGASGSTVVPTPKEASVA